MAGATVPYFKNDIGVKAIAIGAREFKCAGASAPNDHPHVFLDMGDADEIVCPYCSTHYHHRADLPHDGAEPADCAYSEGGAA